MSHGNCKVNYNIKTKLIFLLLSGDFLDLSVGCITLCQLCKHSLGDLGQFSIVDPMRGYFLHD